MSIPKIITDDWPRKLAAIIFAILIWYSVYRQIQEPLTFQDLPVTLVHGNTLAITNAGQLPRLTVTFRGSQRALNKLASSNIRISVTIPDDTPIGPYQVRIKPSDVEAPGRVVVDRIEPATITVNVDHEITVNRQIRAVFSGKPPDGWTSKNLYTTPQRVSIKGPRSLVEDLTEITTQTIQLDDTIAEQLDVDVPLTKYPQITLGREEVHVHVEFTRTDDNKLYTQLPVTVLNRGDSDLYIAEFVNPVVPLVDATIRGPTKQLDELNPILHIRPFVDISDYTAVGVVNLRVRLWLDNRECRSVYIAPADLKVRLARRSPAEASKQPDVPPMPVQAPEPAPEPVPAPIAPAPVPAPVAPTAIAPAPVTPAPVTPAPIVPAPVPEPVEPVLPK